MADFLITTDPGEHHRLQIAWNGDRTLVYISTNHRTMGCSPAMAGEIMRGLMAVLQGDFDRAISESSLRMEQEDAAYRAERLLHAAADRREAAARPLPSHPRPELDTL